MRNYIVIKECQTIFGADEEALEVEINDDSEENQEAKNASLSECVERRTSLKNAV